ncbi:hypothetical protein QA644_29955 (plasmid) [Rhizobium sp. CC1099]|uniref:hypothetical protein n=1 Tax=Rhizobium sp. CC1099 TaxID=3039160 RepID=UPI0024B24AAC|nr:hypothetical protein [Rhizobium sp. CC1099]WFU90220.1 hypothetical protein QA644_29955 [Rhizobium sp. CC1099]
MAENGNGNDRLGITLWSNIQPYFFPALIFLAPILVIILARWIFNDIIEVGRIDMTFLPGATSAKPYPITFISSQVVSSLYNFGFALCAAMVFAVALTAYGSVIIWQAAANKWLKVGFVLILVTSFAIAAFDLSSRRVASDHIPAKIARNLIDKTLYYLPSCDKEESLTLVPCTEAGIGNTGNSLKRVAALGIGIVLVAGLTYTMATAVVAGSLSLPMEDRMARIRSITLLAAVTFLLTIVAVHLLFQPGADMIAGAHAPTKAADIVQLQNYGNLRSAMTLYWATIFSLALGTAYFCAATFVQGQANAPIDFGGVWNVVKVLLAVLSPVIADWVLKFGESFIGSLS